MKAVTPIEPISGYGIPLASVATGECICLDTESCEVEAVAIVIDDEHDAPYFLINVKDGLTSIPAYALTIQRHAVDMYSIIERAKSAA